MSENRTGAGVRPGDRVLTTPASIRVMSSALRSEIVHVVMHRGEASVSDIAWEMDRPATTLYRHIDQLEEAGILREVGTRATGKRDARVFSCGRVWFEYEPKSPARTAALTGFVRTMSRHAVRSICRAFESRRAVTRGDARDTHFFSVSGWFGPDELRELNEQIDKIRAMFDRAERRDGRSHCSVTLVQTRRGDE